MNTATTILDGCTVDLNESECNEGFHGRVDPRSLVTDTSSRLCPSTNIFCLLRPEPKSQKRVSRWDFAFDVGFCKSL
jgi:hypothetical protein